MVDFQAYIQNAPFSGILGPVGTAVRSPEADEFRCSGCSSNKALKENQKPHYDGATADSEFDDLQYIICPPRVLGYHLESKTWLELNIGKVKSNTDDKAKGERYLEDIVQQTSDAALNKLQLGKTQKSLIRDLGKSHASGSNPKSMMEDIMKGKGKGLVILLHGPPGVGKTLTAQQVRTLRYTPPPVYVPL